ncbi:hypothetical protein ONZ45_g9528 [Pleurotus djamor]|nr:hypothetical protein ONZ45_g9528 [Pleurotus djamor]
MSSKLKLFQSPPSLPSSLLKSPPDAVPPTDELETLHSELLQLKQKTLERAKKAGEDLKTIEESFRRMKEREKGKSKAIEKIKREYTPILDNVDDRLANSLQATQYKSRNSSLPLGSVPPSARSSVDLRKSFVGDSKDKKKKKRKRDHEDSDIDMGTTPALSIAAPLTAGTEPPRPRKATPPVNNHIHPPKAQKSTSSLPPPTTKQQFGPDFTLHQTRSLTTTRPSLPPPPVAGPSKPTEVTEDFTKLKPPATTAVSTFYTSIEPWIRPIKEEDVGFLEYTGDEIEPFIMPKLGRHYTELWDDEDAGIVAYPTDADSSVFAPPDPKFEPSQLLDSECSTEEKGHGPLTERVIAALLPAPDQTVWKGVKAAEDAMEGRPGGSGAAAARREKMNVSDLEARIRDTMRTNGLIDGMPDYTEKLDDPIATALRHAQRELRSVLATNKKRRERLVAVARDRLAYQEYLDLRDSIDKNINTLFSKLQKKDGPKLGRKKKVKGGDSAPPPVASKSNGNPGNPLGGISALPPCPAALGLGPDDENKLVVPEQLKQLVETRRQWVDQVGAIFEEKEREEPGRIWGVPKESLFKGIDEEVQAMLSGLDGGKWIEKRKARSDAMDVG